ncbi:MAG: YgeY family selenium metabolism-linked hydrolase [Anaerolineales bacterium]|nr:YgeY family selenium metabolism-linked hydrolase [Anaerolineales bacterium]
MADQDLIQLAQALVRVPSLSGEERAVVEVILAAMRALGYDEVFTDSNGSAVGIIRGARPGPTLLLDAHCDTVGIAPGSTWTRDPFAGELDGGWLYGRGAADMKGALAAMLHGAAAVDRARLAGQVAVSATVLEEVMEGVSLGTVMERVRPDCVVIGEATELNLNRGGRGRAEIQLETVGRPAHSSSPQLGLNAVHAMLRVVDGVERLALGQDPVLGPALLALTDIISDPYPGYSVIPSRCRATYDRRLLAGETPAQVLGALQALPTLAGAELHVALAQGEHTAYTGAVLRGPKFFPAWVFPEEHPLVQGALRGLRAAGLAPRLGAYRFCTNAAYSAGRAGVPTVGFGPAAEGDAHVVDERLAVADLLAAARGYRGIVEAVLAGG